MGVSLRQTWSESQWTVLLEYLSILGLLPKRLLAAVWSPYRKSDIDALEKVQKRQLNYYQKLDI